MREMVGGCCVCSDDRGWSENPLVYCDGQTCTVAVHQACYGIVTVPTGPWYCRKCESQERSVKVKCELCPSKYGALKRTDNSGWAHVVCALYIPEVRFGNVTTMEPIQLQLIPAERFNKVCYICEEKGKPANSTVGACMQCNKAGCRQQFHVTCAQSLGLLCEEAGNYLDNVKYCGYCQHHYSKLKKGGNVKTIPPYKPISTEAHNSDSNSEKEPDNNGPSNSKNSPLSSGKKKSTVSSKTIVSKTSSKSTSSSQPKTVHNSSKNFEKTKVNSKSAKGEDVLSVDLNADKIDKKDFSETDKELKDGKSSKKRKANSRTPTPVSVTAEVSVVVTAVNSANTVTSVANANTIIIDKKNTTSETSTDKSKKAKVDSTHSILTNQPVVALTSLPTAEVATSSEITATVIEPPATTPSIVQQAAQSLVVSVPLVSTSLSPRRVPIVANPAQATLTQDRSNNTVTGERITPVVNGGNSNQGILTSEMSGGGLKITYEKQMDTINTEEDMDLELEPSPSTVVEESTKRGRSQSQSNSSEKQEHRVSRSSSSTRKKRSVTGGTTPPVTTAAPAAPKRSSGRISQQLMSNTPPTEGAFAAVSRMKDSPPSSPSSESQQSVSGRGRTRGRKPATLTSDTASATNEKDTKDIKLFQNGLTAPHMLGNQLNPSSTMHSKMTDHLNSELEAHSIFNPNESCNLVGPQLHHRVVQSARASSTGSSTASGGSGLSSMLGGGGGNIPQTLDQLLERQWEQGSQFLMEQAQHFDIASLLSCLHQLRAENLRLEEHQYSLLQRRDHLLAVNARLAIPLTGQPAAPQPSHSHTVNNIHPSVAATHPDVPRRHSAGSGYPSQHVTLENGLPPDTYPQNPHRSPAAGGQPSPTVRHSPAGVYPSSSATSTSSHRQGGGDSSSRSAPRAQAYGLYDRPGTSSSSSQQQMVIRRERGDRDPDLHHSSSKNS